MSIPKPNTTSCPPPRNFNPAGVVQEAALASRPPPFISVPRKSRGKKAEGMRYERAAQQHFDAAYGDFYVPSPWFCFSSVHTRDKYRYCQPDGLLFDPRRGVLTIIEFKLKHTPNAWWQTRHLYQPVVQKLFPSDLWTISICEVVKWLDPHTTFPERFNYAHSPLDVPPGGFGVHVLKPRRRR